MVVDDDTEIKETSNEIHESEPQINTAVVVDDRDINEIQVTLTDSTDIAAKIDDYKENKPESSGFSVSSLAEMSLPFLTFGSFSTIHERMNPPLMIR